MVGQSSVPDSLVREADPKGCHGPASERARRVQGHAAPERGDPEPGVGPKVAGPVGHHDHVGGADLHGCQQPRPHRHGLELAAERLPARHERVDEPRRAPLGHQSGEGAGKRRAVPHHVRHAPGAGGLRPGRDRPHHLDAARAASGN